MRVLLLLVILAIARVRAAQGDLDQQLRLADHQSRIFASMIPTAFSKRNSSKCLDDSLIYAESVFHSTNWAWKMFSSSGKLSDIYLNTIPQSMGHFDQCLGISTAYFTGRYCTVYLKTESGSLTELLRDSMMAGLGTSRPGRKNNSADQHPASLGLCLPSSCSAEEIRESLELVLTFQLGNRSLISVSTTEDLCYDRTKINEFDPIDITIGMVFAVLAALILAGTCIEWWILNHPSDDDMMVWIKIISCFSLIKNGRRLFSSSSNEGSSESLSCLYGIRFLTMSWIVVGHVWIQGVIQINQNTAGLLEDGRKFQWQGIANGTVAVDGFFLLGGLLVCYNLLQYLEKKKGQLHLAAFYFHRYIRLTPVYIAVLAFVSTLMVHVGSGPNWSNIKSIATNCRSVWWQQLLFINNFVPKGANHQCMTETWYLSNDFQLFLLSPFLVYPLWRWRNKGLVVVSFFTCLSLAGNFAMFYVKGMPPTSMITRPLTMAKSLVDFWVYYYPQPWFRSPPYFVGIFLGYILYSTRDKPVYLSKITIVIGWACSCFTCFLVVFGLTWFTDEDLVPHIHPIISVLYGSFHRFVWAVALAWIIFACVRGYGGFVDEFLSCQFFVPLGRISYCIYLIHYNVILVYYAHKRSSSYYTAMEQFYTVCGNWIISILLALIVHLSVEMPFLNMERVTFKYSQSRNLDKSQESKNEVIVSRGKVNQGFTIA